MSSTDLKSILVRTLKSCDTQLTHNLRYADAEHNLAAAELAKAIAELAKAIHTISEFQK